MATEEAENDDSWLYGENNDNVLKESEQPFANNFEPTFEKPPHDILEQPGPPGDGDGPPGVDPNNPDEAEEGELQGSQSQQNGEDEEDDSEKDDLEDDSDDDINVVIGDIKTTYNPAAINLKRSALVAQQEANKNKQILQQGGKFNVDEFESVGTINGVPAIDFNLDSMEDKPWRKPGADITDYFNYGFSEDTWRAYCERQKRIRVNDSGVGLQPLNAIGLPRGPMNILNDNSKYANLGGNMHQHMQRPPGHDQPKENVIQVLTADRREYSRKNPAFPDLSVPPPQGFEPMPMPMPFQPEFGFNPEPEPYYGGYEPTQDVQWGSDAGPPPNWAPSDIKSLTPGPVPLGPPPNMQMGPPPSMGMPPGGAVSRDREKSPSRRGGSRDRDREPSRSRSEKPRDRERERSHRRERSRSRSRRHKSRSRSPSHRSHKKKKSRRHDDSE